MHVAKLIRQKQREIGKGTDPMEGFVIMEGREFTIERASEDLSNREMIFSACVS